MLYAACISPIYTPILTLPSVDLTNIGCSIWSYLSKTKSKFETFELLMSVCKLNLLHWEHFILKTSFDWFIGRKIKSNGDVLKKKGEELIFGRSLYGAKH